MRLPMPNPALLGALLLMLLAMTVPAMADAETRVEAVGIAHVAGNADRDAARRRALADALVSAALAGGAQMQGYSAVHMGRITADLTILRAAGRVLSHRVLSAELQGGAWRVRIEARVGPPRRDTCSGRRHLTLSSTPPEITVFPDAPAWAEPVARQLARDVVATLRDHPATTLDDLATATTMPSGAAFDYTALTRGTTRPAAGNHRLQQTITVRRQGDAAVLELSIDMRGSDGERITRRYTRRADLPRGGIGGLLDGASRRDAEEALTRGLHAELSADLAALGCQAPQARITLAGGRPSVPLGARHGLTRTTLAFVRGAGDTFGVLEVERLDYERAVLRPLDPTRKAADYAGTPVYFVEVGQ